MVVFRNFLNTSWYASSLKANIYKSLVEGIFEILLVKKVFSKTIFSMFFEELPKIQSILN